MKFYIAARFSRRPECNALAHQLKALGHTITSRWVLPDTDHVIPTGLSRQAADAERERFAREDFDDVLACDAMVSLMEEPRNNSRGGRHVEFGMAVALGKAMHIIGPRETVFHHMGAVHHHETADDFIAHMKAAPAGYAEFTSPSAVGPTARLARQSAEVHLEVFEAPSKYGPITKRWVESPFPDGTFWFELLPAGKSRVEINVFPVAETADVAECIRQLDGWNGALEAAIDREAQAKLGQHANDEPALP